MQCRFCGTNHNQHNCPNCNAPAPEAPQPAPASPNPAPKLEIKLPPLTIASKPAAPRNKRNVGWIVAGVIGFIFLFCVVVDTFLPSSSTSRSSASSSAASSAPVVSEMDAAAHAALLLAGSDGYRTLTEEEYRAQAQPLTNRASLLRTPAQYELADYVITLKIVETATYADGLTGYLGISRDENGRWPWAEYEEEAAAPYLYSIVDLRGKNAPVLFSGDIVTFYGEFRGTSVYNGYLYGKPTIPVLQARYSDLAQDPSALFPLGSEAYHTLAADEYKAQAASVGLDEVKRYPTLYLGTDLCFTVRIRKITTVNDVPAYVADVRLENGEWPTYETRDATKLVLLDARLDSSMQLYAGDVIVVYADYAGKLHTGERYGGSDDHVFNLRYVEEE